MSTEAAPMTGPISVSAPTPPTTIPELSAARVLRITSSGKIRHWVKNALTFLKEHPGLPVVLHTLPRGHALIEAGGSGEDRRSEEKEEKGEEAERDEDGGEAGDDDGEPQTKKRKHAQGSSNNDENPSKKARLELTSLSAPSTAQIQTSPTLPTKNPHTDPSKPSKQPPCTHSIPRLLSTTEIIKREYLASLEPSFSTLTGLHQYNQLGFLEGPEIPGLNNDGGEAGEEGRAEEIIRVLSGKNHLKIRRAPYMKITLCTDQIPALEAVSTYQQPLTRDLTKSMKSRLRKKLKKQTEGKKTTAKNATDKDMDKETKSATQIQDEKEKEKRKEKGEMETRKSNPSKKPKPKPDDQTAKS